MTRHITTYILILTSCYACGQTNKTKKKADTVPTTIELPKGRDTFSYFAVVDTNFSMYRLPVKFDKPKNWIKADKDRKGILGDWYGNTYPDTFDLQDALSFIDTATQLSQIGSAKSWCIKNYQQAFPYLVAKGKSV